MSHKREKCEEKLLLRNRLTSRRCIYCATLCRNVVVGACSTWTQNCMSDTWRPSNSPCLMERPSGQLNWPLQVVNG